MNNINNINNIKQNQNIYFPYWEKFKKTIFAYHQTLAKQYPEALKHLESHAFYLKFKEIDDFLEKNINNYKENYKKYYKDNLNIKFNNNSNDILNNIFIELYEEKYKTDLLEKLINKNENNNINLNNIYSNNICLLHVFSAKLTQSSMVLNDYISSSFQQQNNIKTHLEKFWKIAREIAPDFGANIHQEIIEKDEQNIYYYFLEADYLKNLNFNINVKTQPILANFHMPIEQYFTNHLLNSENDENIKKIKYANQQFHRLQNALQMEWHYYLKNLQNQNKSAFTQMLLEPNQSNQSEHQNTSNYLPEFLSLMVLMPQNLQKKINNIIYLEEKDILIDDLLIFHHQQNEQKQCLEQSYFSIQESNYDNWFSVLQNCETSLHKYINNINPINNINNILKLYSDTDIENKIKNINNNTNNNINKENNLKNKNPKSILEKIKTLIKKYL